MRLVLLPVLCLVAFAATAGNFRAVEESGAVLYDAPSREATPVYVLSRDYPLEVLVELDAWAKVRDAAGAISWIEKKQLGERRTVVVTATSAHATARTNAALRAAANLMRITSDMVAAIVVPLCVSSLQRRSTDRR